MGDSSSCWISGQTWTKLPWASVLGPNEWQVTLANPWNDGPYPALHSRYEAAASLMAAAEDVCSSATVGELPRIEFDSACWGYLCLVLSRLPLMTSC